MDNAEHPDPKPEPISLARCRELLGEDAESMTDQDIEDIRRHTYLRGNEQMRGVLNGGHAKASAMILRSTEMIMSPRSSLPDKGEGIEMQHDVRTELAGLQSREHHRLGRSIGIGRSKIAAHLRKAVL